MGNINPTFKDRVKYEIYHKIEGTLVIEEPIGWDTDEKEYSRNKDYHGVVAKFSNALKFIGNGCDFIELIDGIYGINAEIKLSKFERHPHTDEWYLVYSGYLDLSTMEYEKNQLSLKFNSGGLEQSLKARESENVEIDRLTTIDGLPLPELSTETVLLEGRRIFLKSEWDSDPVSTWTMLGVRSDAGNTRRLSHSYPLKNVAKSHEQVHSIIQGAEGNENVGSAGMMFFALADRTRVLNVSISEMSFKPNFTENNWQWAIFSICLTVYKDGPDFNVKEKIVMFNESVDRDLGDRAFQINNTVVNVQPFRQLITLLEGESLGVDVFIQADLAGGLNRRFYVTVTDMKGKMKIEEDSFFEQSTAKFVLAHELADRLVAINTNKTGAMYSEFLGRTDIGYATDGPGALTGNTHGFWVRGFEKLPIPSEGPPKIENLFKPLTTSFKDFMNSYGAVWNMGMGIETIKNKERVRLEPLSFFYNYNVTIRLPYQVENEKRSKATDYYYSSIETGFEQGGDYEEAMGLDEYNAKTTFTTIISRLTNTYSKLSTYRADSYGKEFARRKPKRLFSTQDTSYDDSIFMMDLKIDEQRIFKERKWQDDFDIAPKGIFSPETATNLRFSPLNILFRHGWFIASGLIKYPTDYIRYGSSVANSSLRTRLAGRIEHAENGNIINSELDAPRFIPEWVEFEHVCDFDIMRQIEGTSKILGKEIPNFYGLVEFINEKNEKERGFLFNLKPNGRGQWKLLTANR